VEVDAARVGDAELIIPTTDTLRHQELLMSLITMHQPLILCGPPGSGKTMTLMSTIRELSDFEIVFLNFSSTTLPSVILK